MRRIYLTFLASILIILLSACTSVSVLLSRPISPGESILIAPMPCPGILEARDTDGDGIIDEAAIIPESECLKGHLKNPPPPPSKREPLQPMSWGQGTGRRA